MTKLTIAIKVGDFSKTIRLQGISDEKAVYLVRETIGLTNSLSDSSPSGHISNKKSEIKIKSKPEASVPSEKGAVQTNQEGARSRQLPLVGSEQRSTFSIGETLHKKSDDKEPPNTKRTEEGIMLFRTHIDCECGHKHKGRHVRADNYYVKCGECQNKLELEAATFENQIIEGWEVPKMNENGAYFIARNSYEEDAQDE